MEHTCGRFGEEQHKSEDKNLLENENKRELRKRGKGERKVKVRETWWGGEGGMKAIAQAKSQAPGN